MADALLRVEGLSKRFGGLAALTDASLSAEAGSITALIGPNGAGKTTLFAAIAGFLRPDRGRVLYGGNNITGEPPYKLARRGIARTFQIVQPLAGLSVRENIAVGAHLSRPARADALEAAGEVARELQPLARGVTILMIEHVMQAVMSLAEQVWVLAEGRIIAQGAPREVAGNPRVVEAYLGHGAASRLVAGGAGVQ